jgi:Flp pilus assembly protein TadD
MELGRDGRASDAVTQFREAVRIMPNMPEARLNLGISLVDAGNYSEALVEFEKVLQQDPTNAKALQYAQALRQKLSSTQPH